jgi:hypothetical protein
MSQYAVKSPVAVMVEVIIVIVVTVEVITMGGVVNQTSRLPEMASSIPEILLMASSRSVFSVPSLIESVKTLITDSDELAKTWIS